MSDLTSADLRTSAEPSDPAWDAFVAATAGGDHLQTTSWAEVKREVGWRAVRLRLERDGVVVGGCQVLLHDLKVGGSIAYVPRGPLVSGGDSAVTDAMLCTLTDFARREHVVYLKVQPPMNRDDMGPRLLGHGFVGSGLEAAPTATVRVDLRSPEEDLLEALSGSMRRNVRQGLRRGLRVRIGGDSDLDAMVELVAATAQRQSFQPYPRRYYEQMWRSFNAVGQACLLLVERDSVVLAFALLIPFGESVVYKAGGWNGLESSAHPNVLLHWSGIRWAREHGFRYYDFDGLNLIVARAARAGRELPQPATNRVPHFKLRFGGEVTFFAPAYDYSPIRI
ncbi:MAG: lipid II:glycine glycyltransferase FemX, partial [Solirubrobacteraceae bacterium]